MYGHTLQLCCCLLLLVSMQSTECRGEEQQPIQSLIQMLESDDRDKRRDASYALASYGPQAVEALDSLIKALNDRDIQIWQNATQAIAHLGPRAEPAIDALLLGIESGDEQRRFRVAYALGSIGTAALPPMRERLDAESGNVREVAVRAIGLMGPDAAVAIPELIQRLGDRGETIRASAVHSLAAMGNQAIPMLEMGLEHEDEAIRAGSAKCLAAMGRQAEKVLPKLIAVCSLDTAPQVRAAATAALGRVAPDQSAIIQPLLSALQDSTTQVKRAAVEAWIPTSAAIQQEATTSLAELLAVDDEALQTGVLLILNRFGSRAAAATPALLAALERMPDSIELTTTIGQIGKPALDATYKALRSSRITPGQMARIVKGMPSTLKREIANQTEDESPVVRELAAATLGDLRPFPRNGAALLSQAIQDSDRAVRLAAAQSAQKVGTPASALTPTLNRAIEKEEDDGIRAAMLQSLATVCTDRKEVLKCLADNLSHAATEVKTAALGELSAFEELPSTFQQPVAALLGVENSDVRGLAAETLSLIPEGHAESATLLGELLDDQSHEVRQRAMRALSRFGDRATPIIDSIVAQLDAETVDTQVAALEALTTLGKRSEAALPQFEALSVDSDETLRKAALAGVRNIAKDPQEAVRVLMGGLQDQQWELRQTAVRELGELEEAAAPAVPALLEMLRSEKDGDGARRALREIGTASQEALPILLDILQDPQSGRRPKYYSLYLLRKMGPKAKDALPRLLELRDKSDGSLGDQFDRTIDSIDEDEDDE